MKELPTDPRELFASVQLSETWETSHDEMSRLYRFVATDTGLDCHLFGVFPDVYEGLSVCAFSRDPKVVALVVAVQGWAAPGGPADENDPNALPPSERPDRERVSLMLAVDVQNRHASRMFFIDRGHVMPEEEVGEAGGTLLDAVRTALHLSRLDVESARDFVASTLKDIIDLNDVGDLPF